MVNIEAILDLLDKCYLDGELTEDNFYENVIDQIPRSISLTYFSGATKLVLLFPGADYVVKIPFTGSGYLMEDYDEDTGEWYEHDNYCPFEGALYSGWNYCETEVQLYELAAEYGIEQFFAKTEFIGHVQGHPIYIQERAEIFDDTHKSHRHSHEVRKSVSEKCNYNNFNNFNIDWIADLFNYCTDEIFCEIMTFATHNLEDLHRGNIGYIDGRPVFVDYSGFND